MNEYKKTINDTVDQMIASNNLLRETNTELLKQLDNCKNSNSIEINFPFKINEDTNTLTFSNYTSFTKIYNNIAILKVTPIKGRYSLKEIDKEVFNSLQQLQSMLNIENLQFKTIEELKKFRVKLIKEKIIILNKGSQLLEIP
jgi:two-component sensor histidine kinase